MEPPLPEERDVFAQHKGVASGPVVGDFDGRRGDAALLLPGKGGPPAAHAAEQGAAVAAQGVRGQLKGLLRAALPPLSPADGADPVLHHGAALHTPAQHMGLVAGQVLEQGVAHPSDAPNLASFVAVVARHEAHKLLLGLFGASGAGVLFALVAHVHAEQAADALLCLGLLQDDVIHVLKAGHAGLRQNLAGVAQAHAELPVAAAVAAPFDMEKVSPLDGGGALVEVVELLEGQPVELGAQDVLHQCGQGLVLLAARRHLGLGDGGVDQALHTLGHDVAHHGGGRSRRAA